MAESPIYTTTPENAAKIWDWLQNRGGIAHWLSADLSDPGWSTTTPRLTKEGEPFPKPHWKSQDTPGWCQTIDDQDNILIDVPKEAARLPVYVKPGNTHMLVLTAVSALRCQKAVGRANAQLIREGKKEGAWYEFDYASQEAVIFVPDSVVPIAQFITIRDSREMEWAELLREGFRVEGLPATRAAELAATKVVFGGPGWYSLDETTQRYLPGVQATYNRIRIIPKSGAKQGSKSDP